MTAPAAAPRPEKPCAHDGLCRCDVGVELARAIEAAGDAVSLGRRAGRAADNVSDSPPRAIRVRGPRSR